MATNVHKTNIDIETGNVESSPRFRANRSASLTLSTTWQRIDFNGTDTNNTNTFPVSSDGTNKMIYWDSTNKIFKFMAPNDRNYTLSLYLKTTSTSLLNLINVGMQTLQMRFVVPNGTSPGVPYYFPFHGEDELVDLMLVNSSTPWRQEYFSTIYADARKRTNGVGIEVRLSATPLGTVTLASTNVLWYGR